MGGYHIATSFSISSASLLSTGFFLCLEVKESKVRDSSICIKQLWSWTMEEKTLICCETSQTYVNFQKTKTSQTL